MKKKKESQGSTLVEIIIALAMISIVLISVAVAGTVSVKNARIARERSEARTISETIMEQIRLERNNNPETFFAGTERVESLPDAGTTVVFSPRVYYRPVDAANIDVEVRISWNSGDKNFSVNETAHFSQWQ